jgi:hypothetical protein
MEGGFVLDRWHVLAVAEGGEVSIHGGGLTWGDVGR